MTFFWALLIAAFIAVAFCADLKPHPTAGKLTRKQFAKAYRDLNEDDLLMCPFLVKSYSHEKTLGTGTYGTVMLFTGNEPNATPKHIAIKIIENKDGKSDWCEEHVHELYLLKAIDHPNVIKFYCGRGTEEAIILITEYLPLGSLSKHDMSLEDKRCTKLEDDRIRQVMKSVLSALVYLHSYGMIHRDIKPDNIMLTEDGAKLIDFGYCTEPTKKPVMHLERPGSPFFAAPELIEGRPYGPSVDIWSFGIVVWCLHSNPYYLKEEVNDVQYFFSLVIENGPWSGKEKLPNCIKEFTKKALKMDPRKRADAQTLLNSMN